MKAAHFPVNSPLRIIRDGKSPNPKGIPSSSPGLRGASYPGSGPARHLNPNGVAALLPEPDATPLGLEFPSPRYPRVARASQPWAKCCNPVGIEEASRKTVGDGQLVRNLAAATWAAAVMIVLVSSGCSKAADTSASAAPPALTNSIADAEAKENSGDVAGALVLYEAALKTAPNDPALHIHIAQAAYKLKKGDRGIQAIDRLMAIDFPNRDTGALLRLKGQFELMRTAASDPKAKAAPASPTTTAPALTGRDRLELDTLNDIWREAESATDAAVQKRALNEVLRRSQSFVEAHPEQTTVWLMRASAGLALDRPREGWEAGQKLLAQGALDSQDTQTRQVMAQLNRRKWLETAAPSSNRAAPGQKYENSLGMKFVPVPGTDVLFCIWETRVKDYSAYSSANPDVDGSWRNVKFKEVAVSDGPTHPVVNVSWEDARAFCAWLTKKEQEEGRLSDDQRYRLPTDVEWSTAVGLSNESGDTPKERDMKIKGVYPWGTEWPPPSRAGNFADASSKAAFDWGIAGYSDGYATTSPVGSFPANRHGLYDLAGNAWEWCDDWYDHEEKARVLRGGSWLINGADFLLSSGRYNHAPDYRFNFIGFRVVLVVASAR